MSYDEIIIKAIEFATEAHKGQKRNGRDYVTHPIAVMEIIKEKFNDNSIWRLAVNSEGLLVMKLLGLFHDIAEDVSQYKNKENDIINDFNSIVRAELKQWMVNSLTFNLEVLNKNRHKNYFEFILAIKKAGLFSTEVKLADLKHNMSDLEEGSLKDKYRLAEYILTH